MNEKMHLLVCILLLSGCASQEQKQQVTHSYFDCVASRSKSIDDGKSSIGDLAMAAVYSCSQYENDIINIYGGEKIVGSSRPKLQKNAYAIAVKTISDRRKQLTNQPKSSDVQGAASCNMSALYESCYKIGRIKKSETDCASIAILQKGVFEKTITNPEILGNIQWLCQKWCGDGVLEKPLISQEELCKQ